MALTIHPPPPSSAEVKERVELYLYSPFWLSWLVLGWTLPFFAFLLSTRFSRHTTVFKLLFVVVNRIYIICAVYQGCTNFAKICEPSQNCGCQNGDLKQVTYGRPINMRCHRLKFRHDGLACEVCASLHYITGSYYACVLRKICDIYILLINPCVYKKC